MFPVEPEAPEILRIDPGFDHLEIHWEESVTKPASPVLDYLVQVKEKEEPRGWRNCSRISASLTCVINDLKGDTVYIVRVAGWNIVGYSEFTEKEARTKATKDKEYKGKTKCSYGTSRAGRFCKESRSRHLSLAKRRELAGE